LGRWTAGLAVGTKRPTAHVPAGAERSRAVYGTAQMQDDEMGIGRNGYGQFRPCVNL